MAILLHTTLMLAVSFCLLKSGNALICRSGEQTSKSWKISPKTCASNESVCFQIINCIENSGSQQIMSQKLGCASTCQETYKNDKGNINQKICCNSDRCNNAGRCKTVSPSPSAKPSDKNGGFLNAPCSKIAYIGLTLAVFALAVKQ